MRNRLIENLHQYYVRALDDRSKIDDLKNELLECRKIIDENRKHDLISDLMYKDCDELIEDYSWKWFELRCK